MLPPILALQVGTSGAIVVKGVAAAGSVPAGVPVMGGMALTSAGALYVVWS